MKKKLLCIIGLVFLLSFSACGNSQEDKIDQPVVSENVSEGAKVETADGDAVSNENAEDLKMGENLVKIFNDEMSNGSSVEDTIEKLMENSGFDCASMECEEGYLNGFTEEIKGFKKATMFGPYIGSIPFVAYIFETDDPKALEEKLLNLSDPRWNVCTEAEETVVSIYDNYVFFAMCPGEDF